MSCLVIDTIVIQACYEPICTSFGILDSCFVSIGFCCLVSKEFWIVALLPLYWRYMFYVML